MARLFSRSKLQLVVSLVTVGVSVCVVFLGYATETRAYLPTSPLLFGRFVHVEKTGSDEKGDGSCASPFRTDGAACLQALLDKGGEVTFPARDYVISRTLVIKGGTHLVCQPGFRARLADGANCPILANRLRGEGFETDISIRGGVWDGNNAHQERSKYEESRYAPGLTFYADEPMGHFDNINIEDVAASSSRKSGGTHGGLIWFQDGVHDIGSVVIRRLNRVEGQEYLNTTPTIEIGAGTRIRNLTLEDVRQSIPDGKPLVNRHSTACIGRMTIVENCEL